MGTEFLSTLSLRRATRFFAWIAKRALISIHALLAESDFIYKQFAQLASLFLSTLSLRRATWLLGLLRTFASLFLSTLSLRRATYRPTPAPVIFSHFYPRSPCGERHLLQHFSISYCKISIHALLAESDSAFLIGSRSQYPFLSTLSLRRATSSSSSTPAVRSISIHALLAESDFRSSCKGISYFLFLSTLSLRRATWLELFLYYQDNDFYPRSPCGERPGYLIKSSIFTLFLSTLSLRRATQAKALKIAAHSISIHALLAESDNFRCSIKRSISNFYPRSPCGERPWDLTGGLNCNAYFYPRSPCGERPRTGSTCGDGQNISIHALLAESDFGRAFWPGLSL